MFSPPVPISRVGHSDPRSQKPDQPDADHQPSQEDHCSGGPQAPMGLRKCPMPGDRRLFFTHLFTLMYAKKIQRHLTQTSGCITANT